MKLNEQRENFDQILESAVVVNWTDLMRGRSGLIEIEYGFSPSGTVDFIKVWASIKRGYWLLACTYGMPDSQSYDAGIHFDNGYESKGLAHILEVVMQHQNLFGPQNLGRNGSLHVVRPTEKESKAAAALINGAVDRVNSLAEPMAQLAS